MEPLSEDDPESIGPYRIIGVLGEGGMGRVYLGAGDDGVEVAVKSVHADLARDREYRKRFAREAEAAGRMRGPYMAAVLAADPDAPRPWLATEYIPAESLWTSVTESGPLSSDRVRELGAALAEALAAVHDAGLVHRDVKPSNVLMAPDGPRLIDFGIARDLGRSTMTRTGMLLGTPQFMAPEQVSDRAAEPTGPPVDVFALGGLLAFAATGRLVFGDGVPAALIYRIVHHEPDLEGIEEPLRSLLARCLTKDPDKRPTAQELMDLFRGGPEAMSAFAQDAETQDTETHVSEKEDGSAQPSTADPDPEDAEAGPQVEPSPARRVPRKAVVVMGAAAVLVVAAAVMLGIDGGGSPVVAAGNSPTSHTIPGLSGSTPAANTTPSSPASSSPSSSSPTPQPSSDATSTPPGPTTTPPPAPGSTTVLTTTRNAPAGSTTTTPAHPATTPPHTTAPAPITTPPPQAQYTLQPAPNGTAGTRCLGTDGTAVSILTDCTGPTAHWKLHQGPGGSIQLETAYVPGQCLHSDEWDQLFTVNLSLATCAGTSDGSQWFTEQAAGASYISVHNTAPGHGGQPYDTCLRTSPVKSSNVASIQSCGSGTEDQWSIAAWP